MDTHICMVDIYLERNKFPMRLNSVIFKHVVGAAASHFAKFLQLHRIY